MQEGPGPWIPDLGLPVPSSGGEEGSVRAVDQGIDLVFVTCKAKVLRPVLGSPGKDGAIPTGTGERGTVRMVGEARDWRKMGASNSV